MYKIIGGDGQEYGPVTDLELRKWISEGRLNAQSLVKAEGDAEFRPLSTFPEFASAFGTGAPAHGGSASFTTPADWGNRDYELDIGGCLSRGWDLFKNNAGILLGCSVLYFLIILAVSFVLGMILNVILLAIVPKEAMESAAFKIGFDILFRVVSALVFGPLIGGFYYVFIKIMRGQDIGVGGLFIGFSKAFPQLFLGYLVFTMVMGLCMVPYNIIETSRMAPLLAQMQHGATPEQMQTILPELWSVLAGSLPILLACMIPMAYLLINLQFSLPLIIDREMDFWTAIKWSWKMTHKHWFTVFGLVLIIGLINIAGALLCCVGFLFTFAITTAAFVFAYETIFGESRRT